MRHSSNMPTTFAKKLALEAEIIVEQEIGRNHVEYMDKMDSLKSFQQMAIVVPFEECLIAFHGQELNDMQVEVLKTIYKSTKPNLLGHVVGVLIDRLDDAKVTNRDFAESVKTIVEQINKEEGGPSEKVKGMLITMVEKHSGS